MTNKNYLGTSEGLTDLSSKVTEGLTIILSVCFSRGYDALARLATPRLLLVVLD